MTNLPNVWTTPLAEADSFMHMGQRFQRHALTGRFGSIVMMVCLLALAVLSAWLLGRYFRFRDGSGAASPRALFAELCRAHRLDWTARRLLSQLARFHQLRSPAQLFVEPHLFRQDRLTGDLRQRTTEIRALRDTIFGGSWCEENPPEDGSSERPGAEAEVAASPLVTTAGTTIS